MFLLCLRRPRLRQPRRRGCAAVVQGECAADAPAFIAAVAGAPRAAHLVHAEGHLCEEVRGPPGWVRHVALRAVAEQQLHAVQAPTAHRHVQRRLTRRQPRWIRLHLHEGLRHARVAGVDGDVQRPVLRVPVQPRAVREQQREHRPRLLLPGAGHLAGQLRGRPRLEVPEAVLQHCQVTLANSPVRGDADDVGAVVPRDEVQVPLTEVLELLFYLCPCCLRIA
mmetsp:Transcript_1312/g.3763  ORF Transcript_1312/g.3763 Transcript_1312/m.3763 type:complete len:223 (-) Transcript_1312:543-1211(-)